jgi:5-methylcytosine-specific restriction endonuclease McrA
VDVNTRAVVAQLVAHHLAMVKVAGSNPALRSSQKPIKVAPPSRSNKEVNPVQAVLVLNADLGPLHRVSLRHAIRMLCREVAVVHEAEPDIRFGVFPMPTVVRLVHYVVTRWRFSSGPAWSRAGVRVRDGGRCAYCGGHATTIDHVLPRSRGGKNSWLNTVAACGSCNQRKGDRTPAEAGLRLRVEPFAPSWAGLAPR